MLDNFERDEGLRHFERGIAFERVNRIVEAVEEYRQAIASYPHLREAHAALGFYYQRHGLLAKAAEAFRIVAHLEGGFLAYFNLGHVLILLERYDEALDALQSCLALDPENPATHYEIALVHYLSNNHHLALKHLYIPYHSYPEDWEVLHFMGKCYCRLASYDHAIATFQQACHIAPNKDITSALHGDIDMAKRYSEFTDIISSKDHIYAEFGSVYLGSTQDDGLFIDDARDYHFTLPDIGVTLLRLLKLVEASSWNITHVVSVDKLAQPLTHALATELHLPMKPLLSLQEDDVPLLVLAVGREAPLLELSLERIPCRYVMSFCLGLNWTRHSSNVPDIVGLVVRGACSVPWEQTVNRLYADRADATTIDGAINTVSTDIIHALHTSRPQNTMQAQIDYYHIHHTSLRFLPHNQEKYFLLHHDHDTDEECPVSGV